MDPRSADGILLALARAVVGLSARAADQLDVSLVQLRALTVLRDLGETTLGGLAAGLGITVSSTSRLVDRLVTAGLVERRPSPRSRRELALSVAPAGRAVLVRYDDLRLVSLHAMLDQVPDGDRAPVLAGIGALTGAAGSRTGVLR